MGAKSRSSTRRMSWRKRIGYTLALAAWFYVCIMFGDPTTLV